jgi:predicted DNA-binding protein (MmcQ/YjbR family)
MPAASPLARLRKLCLALPDTEEKIAWGEPTWRARGKIFAMYASAGTHHTDGRSAVWIKCTPTNQGFILRAKPKQYFKPPYVGTSGWVGAYLDGRVSWSELSILIEDACQLAVKKLPQKRADKRGAGSTRMVAKETRKQPG